MYEPIRWRKRKIDKWQSEDFIWYFDHIFFITLGFKYSPFSNITKLKTKKYHIDLINELLADKVFTKETLQNYNRLF